MKVIKWIIDVLMFTSMLLILHLINQIQFITHQCFINISKLS